jgi:hypothetical protein
MPVKAHHVASYVLNSIAVLLVVYCLFKVFNLSRKVHSVGDFVHSEFFSSKFSSMILNYFADATNARRVLEPVAHVLRDIVHEDKHPTRPQAETGVIFIE